MKKIEWLVLIMCLGLAACVPAIANAEKEEPVAKTIEQRMSDYQTRNVQLQQQFQMIQSQVKQMETEFNENMGAIKLLAEQLADKDPIKSSDPRLNALVKK